jgi:hypothetical protein
LLEYDKKLEEKTGIFLFKKALPKNFCKEIINQYESSNKKITGKTSGGINFQLKNTIDFYIQDRKTLEKLNNLFDIVLYKIKEKYFNLKLMNLHLTGYQFQHNKKGKGYFKPHSDFNLNEQNIRILAGIIYLNTVNEGGETYFINSKYKYKPKEGDLLLFPATWNLIHEGKKPISNDKFIITNFIVNLN